MFRVLSLPISDSKHEFRKRTCGTVLWSRCIWSGVEIKGGLSQHVTDLICQFQASSCLVSLERVWLGISSRKELMEIYVNEMVV